MKRLYGLLNQLPGPRNRILQHSESLQKSSTVYLPPRKLV